MLLLSLLSCFYLAEVHCYRPDPPFEGWVECTDTMDEVKKTINYAAMLIEECTSHCARLDNFEELHTQHGKLISVLNRLSDSEVCSV